MSFCHMSRCNNANLVSSKPIRDGIYDGGDIFELFGKKLISANIEWTPPIYRPFSIDKLAAYRLHSNPNYSHASSLFLSGGGFFLVKPTFSIIEPHFGHLILLFLIKFSGLQLFILLRKCFAYIFLVLLEYVP